MLLDKMSWLDGVCPGGCFLWRRVVGHLLLDEKHFDRRIGGVEFALSIQLGECRVCATSIVQVSNMTQWRKAFVYELTDRSKQARSTTITRRRKRLDSAHHCRILQLRSTIGHRFPYRKWYLKFMRHNKKKMKQTRNRPTRSKHAQSHEFQQSLLVGLLSKDIVFKHRSVYRWQSHF
jgi:hypothetical protein